MVLKLKTFGEKAAIINLGMRRHFLWVFTRANVTTPILSADFLVNFNLSVNMATPSLVDNLTVRRICSRYQLTEISASLPQDKSIKVLLQK